MSIPKMPSKIAIFIPSSAVGGAEHYIKNILYLIEGLGCETIIVLPKNQKLIEFFSDLSVSQLVADIAWLGGSEDLSADQSYLNKLGKQYRETIAILSSIEPDCVFNNLPWVDFGLGITLACHELQIPSINLVHLCPWKVDLNDLTKHLFQDLAASNSYFYTVSNDNRIQLSLSTGIDTDLIRVFYNSRDVNSEYLSLTSREIKLHKVKLLDELDLPLNSFLSVSVGRFSHQKNFLDTLTAFSALKNKLPNYYHLFLGDGELKDYYQKAALDLGIAHRIKFLGYRNDVDRFLALCDLFISSSLYEGLALSILEAAQYSCPIIAANSSSAQEIIPNSDYGLLYNSGQYYLLQRHIEFAYFNQAKMQDKADRLKILCQEKFSLKKFTIDLKNVLSNATDSSYRKNLNQLAVFYDHELNSFKPKQSLNLLNYQYHGLSIDKYNDEVDLSLYLQQYYRQKLDINFDRYLHALYKMAKGFLGYKVMLCFGSFNSNLFRKYYLKDDFLLLVIDLKSSDCCTLMLHHVNHTYWGQDVKPDCLAKFTTYDQLSDLSELQKTALESIVEPYYYTSKYLLDLHLNLDGQKFNNLSTNLKMIESVFQPSEYLLIDQEYIIRNNVSRSICA